jgi:alkanesulfonate monooxygenase SsuD/methylene tetrahydromethanopterin reductase-like flavin-dependent oxidoreductase (luciferase family)
VEGRFLTAPDVAALVQGAIRAEGEGAGAVFLTDGPLGDAVVLAAGLTSATTGLLLGVRVGLTAGAHRHPTVLARDLTALDHVSGGRAVLCVEAPFTDAVAEAVTLCRDMWWDGIATSEGPHYPVAGAINRPKAPGPTSPLLALDLTGGATPARDLLELVDLVLEPTEDPMVCRMQRP